MRLSIRLQNTCHIHFHITGFVVNGVNNVNTTSYERRFNLPSAQVGMISSAYDFCAGIIAIPLTYYGTHAHQVGTNHVITL